MPMLTLPPIMCSAVNPETLDGDIPVVQGTLSWNHNEGWYAGGSQHQVCRS